MKVFLKYALIIVVIIGLGFGVWTLYAKSIEENEVMENINEIKVKPGDLIIDFMADGIVMMPTSTMSFETTGVIKEINVEKGDQVVLGETLATLETEELLLRISKANLNLQSALEKINQELQSNKESVQLQSTIIVQLRSALKEEEETLNKMTTFEALYTPNELSNQQRKIDVANERIVIEQLKLNAMSSSSEVGNELTIEELKVDIKLLELDLKESELVALSSGVVVGINGTVNEAVNTSTQLITLQNQSEILIDAEISEIDIHQVTISQKVYTEFESDYGRLFEGKVTYIDPVPNIDNNGIVTYNIEIELKEYPESIRAGLSTLLRFVIKERLEVLMIPNVSVTIIDNQQYVEVKTETGSEQRQIMAGLTDGISVEVLDGLVSGDTILIRTTK